jgi:hypothetical protein
MHSLVIDDAAMAKPLDKATDRSLHICPECRSELVQPTRWKQEDDRSSWRIWRRCPECEWNCDDIHNEVEIDAFDEQLDRGSRELADGLRGLERTNMNEMASAFIAALSHDLIGADDFS